MIFCRVSHWNLKKIGVDPSLGSVKINVLFIINIIIFYQQLKLNSLHKILKLFINRILRMQKLNSRRCLFNLLLKNKYIE
jgi:hypothetical protein